MTDRDNATSTEAPSSEAATGPATDLDAIRKLLREHLPEVDVSTSVFRDNHRLIVPRDHIFIVLTTLKERAGFDMLIDVTAVDYLHFPDAKDRFAVIYSLLNTQTSGRLYVKTFLNEPDLTLPSCFPLWKGADWPEREVYDMFGIRFSGHPDLRRILLPDDFTDWPLRKDYPLRGKCERHSFPEITRAES